MIIRISVASLIGITCSLFLMSFSNFSKRTEDLWKQLGITELQGNERMRNSFFNGYLEHYGMNAIKAIPVTDRAAISIDLLEYCKKYVSSAAFKEAYAKERENTKPVAPVKNIKSLENIRKDQITEMEKAAKNSEETIKQMPDMEKVMRPTIDLFKQTIKQYKDPKNPMIEAMYQNGIREYEERVSRHEDDLKKWELNYPVKFETKLKGYLEKYLSLAGTVDFSAKLEDKFGKKRFVDPKFEGKSADWKMMFRAGKEAQSAAVPFIGQWIKEL